MRSNSELRPKFITIGSSCAMGLALLSGVSSAQVEVPELPEELLDRRVEAVFEPPALESATDAERRRVRARVFEGWVFENIIREHASQREVEVPPKFADARREDLVRLGSALVPAGAVSLLESMLPPSPVSREAVERFYQARPHRFQKGAFVYVSEIRVPGRSAADRERIEELRRSIVEEGRSFSALARRFSSGPSARRGGDLGEVRPGDLPTELWAIVEELEENEVSPVIEDGEGLLLLRRRESVAAIRRDLDEVREQIREEIQSERRQARLLAFLQPRRTKLDVQNPFEAPTPEGDPLGQLPELAEPPREKAGRWGPR